MIFFHRWDMLSLPGRYTKQCPPNRAFKKTPVPGVVERFFFHLRQKLRQKGITNWVYKSTSPKIWGPKIPLLFLHQAVWPSHIVWRSEFWDTSPISGNLMTAVLWDGIFFWGYSFRQDSSRFEMNPKLEQSLSHFGPHVLCSKVNPQIILSLCYGLSNFWRFNAEFFFLVFVDESKGVTTSSSTTTSTTAEVSATTVPIVIVEAMLVLLFVHKAAYSSSSSGFTNSRCWYLSTYIDCRPDEVFNFTRFFSKEKGLLQKQEHEWIGHFKTWFYRAGGRLL